MKRLTLSGNFNLTLYYITGLFADLELSIAFGVGKDFVFYSINSKIGSETSKILALFHAFSGCDTTSSFHGKGKKSAWEALISFPEVKIAFQLMVAHPLDAFDETAKHFASLERFTVILYDRTSTCNFVNKAR